MKSKGGTKNAPVYEIAEPVRGTTRHRPQGVIDEETRAAILEAYPTSETVVSIAARLGVRPSAVTYVANTAGVFRPRTGRTQVPLRRRGAPSADS